MRKIFTILLVTLPILVHAQLQPKISVSYGSYNISFCPKNINEAMSYRLPHFMFRTGLEYTYKKLSAYYDQKVWCYSSGRSFSPQQAVF